MSNEIVKANQLCSKCFSATKRVFADGTSYCTSCKQSFPKENIKIEASSISLKPDMKKWTKQKLEEISAYQIRGFKERRIPKVVCEFFGVKVSYDEDGQIDAHYYPYDKGKSYKQRELPKDFKWINKTKSLFGEEHFSSGGKRLIITEGEIDLLSVGTAQYLKYRKFYPVVAISSTGMVEETLLYRRKWIRSFDEVILCFDQDDAGDIAVRKATKIIGLDKVKIAKLNRNDANDVLRKDGGKALLNAIFDAAAYIPVGILDKYQLKAQMHSLGKEVGVPYPPCFGGVNKKIKGMRLGEIALFISGTGCGKSTIVREIILHILDTVEDKIGLISLEEVPGATARSLASMKLSKNLAYEEISEEEIDIGFDAVFGTDRVIVLDHQGSIKDDSIIDQIEYMALMGCNYIFIDHITILVSEGSGKLTGNEAIDKIMNDLLRLSNKHRIHLGLISHLRKSPSGSKSFEEGILPSLDDIKGSGSIKQVCLDIIAASRNMKSGNEKIRNYLKLAVLKCRATGLTGPVAGAMYNFKTGRYEYESKAPKEEKEEFVKI